MSKYNYSTTSKDIKNLDKQIFMYLMKMGFRIKRVGTIHFKNIVLLCYLCKDSDLSYSESIRKYSTQIGKSAVTIRSEISDSFLHINTSQYVETFSSIFEYDTNVTSINPSTLYECFSAFLQLEY